MKANVSADELLTHNLELLEGNLVTACSEYYPDKADAAGL
jgi:hypothetical protein